MLHLTCHSMPAVGSGLLDHVDMAVAAPAQVLGADFHQATAANLLTGHPPIVRCQSVEVLVLNEWDAWEVCTPDGRCAEDGCIRPAYIEAYCKLHRDWRIYRRQPLAPQAELVM
jgi:hypothetical protein